MEAQAHYKKQTQLQIFKKTWRQHWIAYLMLIIPIVTCFIFSYIPMYGILIAFKNYKPRLGILGSDWVGLDHFIRFFGGYHFPMLLRNTLHISLYGLLVGFPLPIVLALLLNEMKSQGYKKVVQTISYMPYFISTVVICGMLKSFMNYDGVFSQLVQMFGGQPISLLSEPEYFPSIIVWSDVWQTVGWNSIIYMAALSGIDQQLYEAARIDGCNRLGQTWHVTLPGIVPTIITLLILSVGGILGANSEKILLLYTPLTYETGDVFGTYTYRLGIRGGQYDFTAAVGLASTIVGFFLTVAVNWISKKTTETSLW